MAGTAECGGPAPHPEHVLRASDWCDGLQFPIVEPDIPEAEGDRYYPKIRFVPTGTFMMPGTKDLRFENRIGQSNIINLAPADRAALRELLNQED